MDDRMFSRVLLVLIAVVGLLGLASSGTLDSITGAASKKVVAAKSDSILLDVESAKQQCEDAETNYMDGCGEIVTERGVLRPIGANCAQMKNDVSRLCNIYQHKLQSVRAEKSLRGTLPTGGVVAVDDSDSFGGIAGIPWSLVLVGGLVLFLYYERRRTR